MTEQPISPEGLPTQDRVVNDISHLYLRALGRAADRGGATYYKEEFKSGRFTFAKIQESLITSKEAKRQFRSGITPIQREEAINHMYFSLLGHPIDEKARKNFVEKNYPLERVMLTILNSREHARYKQVS